MKQLTRLTTIFLTILLLAGTALAADGANPKKGKYLWKKNCKTCHVEGQEGGVLSPSSKTQSQWNAFFEGDQEGSARQRCKDFPAGDLRDIRQYMNDHALDSDQPETCG